MADETATKPMESERAHETQATKTSEDQTVEGYASSGSSNRVTAKLHDVPFYLATRKVRLQCRQICWRVSTTVLNRCRHCSIGQRCPWSSRHHWCGHRWTNFKQSWSRHQSCVEVPMACGDGVLATRSCTITVFQSEHWSVSGHARRQPGGIQTTKCC